MSHKELVNVNISISDSPATIASDLLELKKISKIKIIGGCCGTTTEHIRALAQLWRDQNR